ncbi:hypothetical protein [Streptomyces sp. SudanB91_2054]|uniref:hypothetical protein n=1 Tax=Streptomyces sp. SudanB91_2054 TaxID=3035278 RepID=UPI0036D9B9CE
MTVRPARVYKVINPRDAGADARARLVFTSAAPVGAIVTRAFGGRTVRVLLDDYLVHDQHGSYLAAQVEVTYL